MAAVRKAEGYTLLFLEIFIIIMNTLAIIVILRFKRKYNPDILIFTLAIADLLKAFIPLNMTLVVYLGGNAMREGSASCNIFGWTAFTLNSGIMLVMTVMAIDRYVAICWPFRYKHYLSKKRLIYTIIAVFVFSGFHSMLPFIGVGQMRSYNNGSFCHFDFDSTIPASLGYNIFVLVFGISMLVVVIFCYTQAMFSIRGLIRRQRRMSTPSRDIDNADQKRQAMNRMFARLMIVMMMAFCVSWLLFLIVVLQHVSGWFEIPPEAHFWSMRLAVLNSVLNPIIGAAMCRPYRRGYMYILCKCLHCFGLCSTYNAEDPWTRSRKMSAGSRNSSDRDQNESPNTCETTKSPLSRKVAKSKVKNNPSFNSYYDSGIVPDSSDYHGTIGRHQAGVVNNAYELDTTPAGVTGHISDDGRFKTRPGLNRKRISFKDEVEAKQMAGVLPKGDEVADPVSGVSDISNTQRPATSFDPPTNQDEVNGAENGLFDASNENQPISDAVSCPGIGSSKERRGRKYGYSSGVDQFFFEALIEPSSLGKPLEKNDFPTSTNSNHIPKQTDKTEVETMYEVQTPLQNSASHQMFDNEQATADVSPKVLISNGNKSDQIAREISLMERSEQRQLTSPRDWYLGANQDKSTFETVQVTHFPVDTSSDVKTSTLKSKSSSTFTPFSLRSSSFIERTQKKSLQDQKPRSQSLANDFSASEASSINVTVNFPENTTPVGQDPRERQHSFHPTMPKRAYGTGALLDTPGFKTDGTALSELLPNLSKTKSFESMLSNTRYKSDSTAYEGLYLAPFQRHSSSFKGRELKGTYKWSQSEPDLTRTLPATASVVSPRTIGEQRPSNERYTENVQDSYQRRASSPQVMPLSPSKIYIQLSELSQRDLEREVFF